MISVYLHNKWQIKKLTYASKSDGNFNRCFYKENRVFCSNYIQMLLLLQLVWVTKMILVYFIFASVSLISGLFYVSLKKLFYKKYLFICFELFKPLACFLNVLPIFWYIQDFVYLIHSCLNWVKLYTNHFLTFFN